jgi:hypothetical protein
MATTTTTCALQAFEEHVLEEQKLKIGKKFGPGEVPRCVKKGCMGYVCEVSCQQLKQRSGCMAKHAPLQLTSTASSCIVFVGCHQRVAG